MANTGLPKKLGSYQGTESTGILPDTILVITGCITTFVYRNTIVICTLVFAGATLFLLAAQPVQKKKKALMQQQPGGFFYTELTEAFGPESEPATPSIDWAYLGAAELSVVPFTECTVADFHRGERKELRFSAANVELRCTTEEKSGPNNGDQITRAETLFCGVVVRCENIYDPVLDIALNDMFQEKRKDDITEPAALRKHFSAHTVGGREADDRVTPQLRDLIQRLEASSRTSKLCGLILRDDDLTLALNTRYVFMGIPEELDLRDIDGICKWLIASLTGMDNLLDLVTESLALTGTTEQEEEYERKKQEHDG